MNAQRLSPLRLALSLVTVVLAGCASSAPSEREATRLPPPPADAVVPHNFGPNYRYNELMIKDYDEMHALTDSFIRKAHGSNLQADAGGDAEAVEYLGRALKLIFSRPDSDNMVTKLLADVRRELVGYNSYEPALEGLAVDAILVSKNENASVIAQTTALVELGNLLREIRPDVENGSVVLRRVVQRIRDARLTISDAVKRELQLRGMFKVSNPSDEARDLIKHFVKKKK